MLIITAFNYDKTYSLSTPSIEVSKVVLEDNRVLCLQINIASIEYINSLIVEPKNTKKNHKRVFVFDSNTKRATVYYYFNEIEKTDNLEFSIKIKNNESKIDFERILKLTEI